MSLKKLSRRSFLAKNGMALGVAAVLVLTVYVPVAQALPLYDPVPDPYTAGWQKEGSGTVSAGAPLRITDPSTAGGDFCTLFNTQADFGGVLLLTPRVGVDPGFNADPSDGSLGVHVTFSDGAKEARAVLLKAGPSQVRVAVKRASGYSAGFAFPGLVADFEFSRDPATGDVMLRALGREEPTLSAQLPVAQRGAVKAVEFGTYNVPAASVTTWETLGLPKMVQVPQPSTLLLLGSGLAGLVVFRRRFKGYGS